MRKGNRMQIIKYNIIKDELTNMYLANETGILYWTRDFREADRYFEYDIEDIHFEDYDIEDELIGKFLRYIEIIEYQN